MKISSILNLGNKRTALQNLLKTVGILALALGISLCLSLVLHIDNQSIIMVFLMGVLFTSVATAGSGYGLLVSVLAVILLNFFFTEPRFTFVISSTSDLILLVFFAITAVVSGMVTARLQTQMKLTAENERTARTLYQIALGFLDISGEENVIEEAKRRIHMNTGLECQTYLKEDDAQTAYGIDYQDYDILCTMGKLGTLRVFTSGRTISQENDMILTAVATQLGTALYRERLRAEQENIRIAMEREQQRSTMLRSVAHDLRSPLTALYGTSSLMADNYDRLSDEERREMAGNMSDEILWLISLVENILNMTRINENRLVLHKERETLDDLVSEAVQHTERLRLGRPFSMSLPSEVISLPADGKLVVQVLINLLENAVKHTPDGTAIMLTATARDGLAQFCVADEGQGVPDEKKDAIFDRFVMGEDHIADGRRGLGLGLAICRAIVEAHGGKIWVEDHTPCGAQFMFTLPLEEEKK
jgi:two-component system sensor histidine kinase KdpD